MAENDIYNNKMKYERFLGRLDVLADLKLYRQAIVPGPAPKYFCRNPANIRFFRKLANILAARDTSYPRRLKLMNTMKLICFATTRDLETCAREHINAIIAFAHERLPSPKSKTDFIRDVRFLWRQLLSELDEKGRPDESLTPYAVRHLSPRMDKSREKRRKDRLTFEEFEKLVQAFAGDIRMQAFVTLTHESLSRPQELLYVRITDVELHDNYAKVWISEHGKEGTGFLQCIDSYPYVTAWLNAHPRRHDPDAFFFCNLGNTNRYGQLKPENVNKHLREKCKLAGIDKPITGYSLKRNGVTYRRLRGDSDVAIQHAARWTSTKQLNTYDMSVADDAFKIELSKRGLINDGVVEGVRPASKTCGFCQTVNGVSDTLCRTCKRPLDRQEIEREARECETVLMKDRKERERLNEELNDLRARFADITRMLEGQRNILAPNRSIR